jgi:CHASE3 domain sensor protein
VSENSLRPPPAASWPLITGFCVALALVIGINGLWWNLDRHANTQADLVDHTHQIIASLGEVPSRSSDMLVGQRAFVLTHDPDYLQPFMAATNRMPVLMHSLEELTRDNPIQKKNLESLGYLVSKHEKMNREHLERLLKGNPLDPDLDFRREVKQSLDAIRNQTADMIESENRLLIVRRSALQRYARLVTMANIVSGFLSVGLLVAVFTALWRENARRRVVEAELWASQEELESGAEHISSLMHSAKRLRDRDKED